jgi:hypothetical protein
MEAIDYDGDGYADLFPNAMRGFGPDNSRPRVGEVHLVSGFHLSGQSVGLTSLSPGSARLGAETTVTVRGTGFTLGTDTVVRVGERLASDVEVVDGKTLTARFPASQTPGAVTVQLENRHGSAELTGAFAYVEEGGDTFVRSDSNGNGVVLIEDPIHTLEHLFLGEPTECLDRHDTNDDGLVDTADALATLSYLFLGLDAPQPPFPEAGTDPTADDLTCP